LFGEHQDYLGLPVIALAIPLHCRIQVTPNPNSRILELEVPALDQIIRYDLDHLPQSPSSSSSENPDFALAAIHEVLKDGWEFTQGATCVSTTEIPMQAGCSSSTAFCVAWILVLAKLARKLSEVEDPLRLAQLAHKTEVLHFGAPGGTMDHVTIAVGESSCLRIGPGMWEVQRLDRLSPKDGIWILADSGEPKDTMGHLKRCKGDRLALLNELGGNWDANLEGKNLDQDQCRLLEATLTNRDTEAEASKSWTTTSNMEASTGEKLGSLMMKHHEALRDGLGLSTTKLEAMGKAAITAGAWGYKLVGSGGGGCAVAWTSKDTADAVAKAMEGVGARITWRIEEPSQGARIID
jgi:galactokinase